MKRRAAPSLEELQAAIDAAEAGKGRKLAELVKSFSVEDLAAGFSKHGPRLHHVLAHAVGRKEYRGETASLRREWRRVTKG